MSPHAREGESKFFIDYHFNHFVPPLDVLTFVRYCKKFVRDLGRGSFTRGRCKNGSICNESECRRRRGRGAVAIKVIHREEDNECCPLPCQLEDFGPVVNPGLHPLFHGDDDGVGLVVCAVLGALLGGT